MPFSLRTYGILKVRGFDALARKSPSDPTFDAPPSEHGCNVVLELEALLFERFEHLVGGGLVLGFDATDVAIDLVVAAASCLNSRLVLVQPLDERRLTGKFVSQFVGKVAWRPRSLAQLTMRDRRSALRWINRNGGVAWCQP